MKNKMEFKKYQHVERFGATEVDNIEIGSCYVFPKIDGTNASVWWNDGVQAGSRNRHISIGNDNAGFAKYISENEEIKKFLEKHKDLRLYGEWLVPHSLKSYRDEAWRKFYVFDVCYEDNEGIKYLSFAEYSKLLEGYKIEYITPICKAINPTYEKLIEQLESNTFLIKNGEGFGEGIVIKNYDFVNRFGRTTWAKIVSSEFKDKHRKKFNTPVKEWGVMLESEIVDKYVTKALCEKEYAKIVNEENGWQNKFIPRILNVVFYSLVTEECWNFVKEHKNPKIDFKTLKNLTQNKVKKHLNKLF